MKQTIKTMVLDLLTVEQVASVSVTEKTMFTVDEVENRKPDISVWTRNVTYRFSAEELSEYISRIHEIIGLDFTKRYSGSHGLPSISYTAKCDDFKITIYTYLHDMDTLNEVAGCEMALKENKYTSTSFVCKVKQP